MEYSKSEKEYEASNETKKLKLYESSTGALKELSIEYASECDKDKLPGE